jgi:hypothetical protein
MTGSVPGSCPTPELHGLPVPTLDYCANCNALPAVPGSRDELAEEGRRLASEREDLIAAGVNPAELAVPLHPSGSRDEAADRHGLPHQETGEAHYDGDGCRDEALTDDIIEAAAKAIAGRTSGFPYGAVVYRSEARVFAEAVLAAALPRLRAHIARQFIVGPDACGKFSEDTGSEPMMYAPWFCRRPVGHDGHCSPYPRLSDPAARVARGG